MEVRTMILGRAPALWAALLAAILNVAVVVFNVPLSGLQVGALNTLGLVTIGILANESDPRTVPTLAPTLQDRRAGGAADPGTPQVGRRATDETSAEMIGRRIGQPPDSED
jgi:hypothetical protein